MTKINPVCLILFITLLNSCNDTTTSLKVNTCTNAFLYADIIGDNEQDTIISTTHQGNTTIRLKQNNKTSEIIRISPMFDSSYNTTTPPIENVYLEPNYIQNTEDKGLRVMVRNTDIKPDCFFIDLKFKDKWYIEDVGVISTVDSIFIKKAHVDRTVENIYESHHGCNINLLVQDYIKLTP